MHRRAQLALAFALALAASLLTAQGAEGAPNTGGAQLWVSRYDGPASADDWASAEAMSPDGSKAFVTGWSDAASTDFATLAYDVATGTARWLRRYDGPGHASDYAYAVAVSPDGSKVFVTGSSGGIGTGQDFATVAYGVASGSVLWIRRYKGPTVGDDQATSIAVSPDGAKVYVTGYSFGGTTGYDYATVAYNAATGSSLWVERYDGTADWSDFAFSVAAGHDGSKVFVTGASSGAGSFHDYTTVAYDSGTGAELWEARYNGPANSSDMACCVVDSPDGSKVFVTGFSDSNLGDYLTVGYDAATGAQLWEARWDGTGHGPDDATSIAVSPDGSKVFVTGIGTGATGGAVTFAYDSATGVQLWTDSVPNSSGASVAMSPDGSTVYVAGAGPGPGGYPRYLTVAYDSSSGARLWDSFYKGPNCCGDVASAVVVAPDGATVVVTGRSYQSNGNYDYATVAYASTFRGRDRLTGPPSRPNPA